MDYLHKFDTNTEYNNDKDNFKWATVSYVEDIEEVKYMENNMLYQPLTLIPKTDDMSFTVKIGWFVKTTDLQRIQYKKEGDSDWTLLVENTNRTQSNGYLTATTPVIQKGRKIFLRGFGTRTATNSNYPSSTFINCSETLDAERRFDVEGNIMSLLFGNDFSSQTALTADFAFAQLFNGAYITSAKNLLLPATTLSFACYMQMFNNSTIIHAPAILPALQMTTSCYNTMFSNCNNLEVPPVLPSKNLAPYCYSGMFIDCWRLFTAPKLPAKTLVTGCYMQMFCNCFKLNHIEMMGLNNTDGTNVCTSSWVSQVASAGVFVKNRFAKWNTTGSSGVPSGWTVVYSYEMEPKPNIVYYENT